MLPACGTVAGPSTAFDPTVPTLDVGTVLKPCVVTLPEGAPIRTECRYVWEQDWVRLVTYAKAACLAHGGTDAQCQTERTEEER